MSKYLCFFCFPSFLISSLPHGASPAFPFEREKIINIEYKGVPIEHYYVADFVCFDHIIVELKAVTELNKTFDAQVLNYLNATGYETGLLINFGESSLKHHRIFNACRNNPYNP